ncbi:MAG: DUF4298 domain-containing protein [Saccharofermentans sp.]|nr:DUF4298 domain-containing protein [Saccharofermentans sp.]
MKEQRAIERISQMEEILDRASSVMAELEKNLSELESLQPDIQKLEAYYTGKDWKADFRLDGQGKLPQDLKRGVLSEDAVYDLLEKNRELLDLVKKDGEA